jgi:hypothetical protein
LVDAIQAESLGLKRIIRDFLLAKGSIVVRELQDISELQLLAAMGWLG